MGEGIAIDAAGNIYTAEANLQGRDEIRQAIGSALRLLSDEQEPDIVNSIPGSCPTRHPRPLVV